MTTSRKLLITLLVLFVCLLGMAQFTTTAYRIRFGASLPATCKSTTGDVFFRTSPVNVYYCSALNTWSVLGGGSGDVVGPSSSVDNEIALFDGVTGKLLKRATTTGLLKGTSGVISAATANTDYQPPVDWSGSAATLPVGYSPASMVPGAVTTLSGLTLANQTQIWKVWMPKMTVAKLAYEVASGGGVGCGLRVALLSEDRSSTVIDSGALSGANCETAEEYSVTLGATVAINEGMYWLAFTSSSNSLRLRAIGTSGAYTIANPFRVAQVTSSQHAGLSTSSTNSGASIAWPGSFAAPTAIGADWDVPIVWFVR